MTPEEINKLKSKYAEYCRLNCDEYHAHSARCLAGPEPYLTVVKLCEELQHIRGVVDYATEELRRALL